MRIERIKVKERNGCFEERFNENDNVVCVIDNEMTKSGYCDGFLSNVLSLLKVNEDNKYKEKCLTECDVSLPNGEKYTVKVEDVRVNTMENGKRGFTSTIKRSYLTDEKIYDNNKRKLKFKYEDYVKDLNNLEDMEDSIVFYGEQCSDFDTLITMFLYAKYEDKLDNFAREYVKENSPVNVYGGWKLYFNPPKTPNNYWDVILKDKNDDEWVYEDDSKDVYLIQFVIANNVIQKLSDNEKDFNYPIFIKDVFGNMETDFLKTIMELIRKMGRQVFIVLRKPNEFIQSYCDKTVTYYYNPNNKDDDLPLLL